MILYFGDPVGALALLDRGLALSGVAFARVDAPQEEQLLPRLQGVPRWFRPRLSDPALQVELAGLAPRLIVSAFYPRRLPGPVLDLAPAINVHPSDLPRWRGPDPIYWTIRAGDPRTAVCVHRMTAELDAGEVLRREPVDVLPDETAGKLAERLAALGAELVAEVAAAWLAGEVPVGAPQTGEPTWAPFVRGDELRLDPALTPEELHRAVLAGAPFPGARLVVRPDAPPVEVLIGEPRPGVAPWGAPGDVRLNGSALELQCAGGAYAATTCRRGTQLLWGPRLERLVQAP